METNSNDGSSVELQYIKDDFTIACWLDRMSTRGQWLSIMLYLPVVSSTITILLAGDRSVANWFSFWLFYLFIIPLSILAFLAVFCPWYGKRVYNNYPLFHVTTRMMLRPEGLLFQSSRGESNFLWKDFIHWRANDKTILLYVSDISPHLFLHIPTRLTTLGFSINDLNATLHRELGAPRR